MAEHDKIKDLQDRLQKIRVRDLLSEKITASLIGINRQCLQMFIDNIAKPQFVTLAKIEKFVVEREGEDGK
jgi:hypothetical protein